jgi:hypothetical protein
VLYTLPGKRWVDGSRELEGVGVGKVYVCGGAARVRLTLRHTEMRVHALENGFVAPYEFYKATMHCV